MTPHMVTASLGQNEQGACVCVSAVLCFNETDFFFLKSLHMKTKTVLFRLFQIVDNDRQMLPLMDFCFHAGAFLVMERALVRMLWVHLLPSFS